MVFFFFVCVERWGGRWWVGGGYVHTDACYCAVCVCVFFFSSVMYVCVYVFLAPLSPAPLSSSPLP
jgi:hypothetical protein